MTYARRYEMLLFIDETRGLTDEEADELQQIESAMDAEDGAGYFG